MKSDSGIVQIRITASVLYSLKIIPIIPFIQIIFHGYNQIK